MTWFDQIVIRLLLASAGCLAAGAGVGLLMVLLRRLPRFALQRSTWLLAQLTIAAVFCVMLLPQSERLRLVPPIELEETMVAGAQTADAAVSTPTPAEKLAHHAPQAQRPWLLHAARAWLVIYLAGLSYVIIRRYRAARQLDQLARTGTAIRSAPLAVIEVDAPISPMLFGLFRPRLLLPRHLRSFDPAQQALIMEHEFTHLRRRDLHWLSAGMALETLFWFNPVMRLLRTQLAWAQELGCDRDVLQGRAMGQRKAYAAALLLQLKLQHRPLDAALAFGSVKPTTLAARMALIREPLASTGARPARLAAASALALVLTGSLALQPALSLPGSAAAAEVLRCTTISDAASGASLVRAGQCDERVTPASTFNIVISLMGYDSGVLVDEHSPLLPYRAGSPDWIPAWRQATRPDSWLKNSVLWYAQEITARIGADRFQHYVQQFDYGNQDVSGDQGKDNGLAMSWVGSSLTISADEQVSFLRKVVNRQLAISPKAYDMTSRILTTETLANGWEVAGKTGTAAYVGPDGKDDAARQYGWYVGWAKKGERTVVFARLLLLKREGDKHAGPRVKHAFLRELPRHLDSL